MAPDKADETGHAIGLLARHQTSQIFRQLLDAAPDAVVVVDTKGQILFANLQTERLFDYARDALIGKTVETLIPERLRSAHVAHRQSYGEAPRLRPMGGGLTLYGRKRDGTEFPIEISLSPLATESGTLFSASIRDISLRLQEEAGVRRIQQHLLSAVESIQGAFAIFDAGDRLVLCNSAYRQIIGTNLPGSIVGRSFQELLTTSVDTEIFTAADASELLSRWLAYHEAPKGALDVSTSSGQHLRVVERPTPEGGVVTSIFDVTDDVAHEQALHRAQALAEKASSAKSEFLSSMSHELRTPLNAVLGFAQLLQRDKKAPLSPRQQERVEHVVRGGEHLLRLIDDVLDLARIEAGNVLVSPEPVLLSRVLSEVIATLEPMATRAGVRLLLGALPNEAQQVVADRTRLKQILMNYGANAVKYGREGGRAEFLASARDGVVRISVDDDGPGIPLDKQPSIFQPFQRAGQETGPIEGTGIGLVISKRLAELMGGTVGFESTEGVGSRFWLELCAPAPNQSDDTAAAGEHMSENTALTGPEGPRYVIVYVEDNPSNIAFMVDLLADFERVELLTAPTAEIGLELVRARRPDVVIMDINLPGMSGLEATRLLKSWPQTQDIPIVALSAAAMIRDAERVAGAGFYRYLTKPVMVDELTATLEELLHRDSREQAAEYTGP
jgi:PAS domain S-box-containing protein